MYGTSENHGTGGEVRWTPPPVSLPQGPPAQHHSHPRSNGPYTHDHTTHPSYAPSFYQHSRLPSQVINSRFRYFSWVDCQLVGPRTKFFRIQRWSLKLKSTPLPIKILFTTLINKGQKMFSKKKYWTRQIPSFILQCLLPLKLRSKITIKMNPFCKPCHKYSQNFKSPTLKGSFSCKWVKKSIFFFHRYSIAYAFRNTHVKFQAGIRKIVQVMKPCFSNWRAR